MFHDWMHKHSATGRIMLQAWIKDTMQQRRVYEPGSKGRSVHQAWGNEEAVQQRRVYESSPKGRSVLQAQRKETL